MIGTLRQRFNVFELLLVLLLGGSNVSMGTLVDSDFDVSLGVLLGWSSLLLLLLLPLLPPVQLPLLLLLLLLLAFVSIVASLKIKTMYYYFLLCYVLRPTLLLLLLTLTVTVTLTAMLTLRCGYFYVSWVSSVYKKNTSLVACHTHTHATI